MKTSNLRERLALGTAMAGVMLTGYGRAIAGTCNAANPIICLGAANTGSDVTQSINFMAGGVVSAGTVAGFGIDTATHGGSALSITGAGTFNDPNASAITGATTGISGGLNGAGVLTVFTTGVVTGVNGDGINLSATGAGSLSLSANTVKGSVNGIFGYVQGTGALSISSSGVVTGSTGMRIFASNSVAATGALTVQAAQVTGATVGINAHNSGSGQLFVSATGLVTGVAFNGVYAIDGATGHGVTVAVASVTAANHGIGAIDNGLGALSVTSSGLITAGNIGVVATTHGNASLTVSASQIASQQAGIYAANYGTGAIAITASGQITSAHNAGVVGFSHSAAGGALSVNVAGVSGNSQGIYTVNFGTGATQITATGLVTGSTGYDGIYAVNRAPSTGGLTITANSVSGGKDGISAINYGSGAFSITVMGRRQGRLETASIS